MKNKSAKLKIDRLCAQNRCDACLRAERCRSTSSSSKTDEPSQQDAFEKEQPLHYCSGASFPRSIGSNEKKVGK